MARHENRPDEAWIAVDWGTSNLRAWVIGPDGAVRAREASARGAGMLAPEAFEPALLEVIGRHLPEGKVTTVIACGMVGARECWAEAPYDAVPCPPPGLEHAVRAPTRDPRLDVRILPGLKQLSPPDVLRGEETQIAGFLATHPRFDGIVCLPGTHSKWVHVSAGEIVSFRTYMTGEIYGLLAERSVLSHALRGEGWDEDAFVAAVAEAMANPQHLSSRLFALRADALLNGTRPAIARARLSGYLVGLELAGARGYWLGQDVALLGEGRLCDHYEAALRAQGLVPRRVEGEDMALVGLKAARAGAMAQGAGA
ncbi:MAG: 2-dehydro-3-deoxygalactonokinase [Alphaproteobacteria bacterium]|nr:MAG: 2-dehydro-3-deoxygalactonokinase [Alphaproteobacteria bacterium]